MVKTDIDSTALLSGGWRGIALKLAEFGVKRIAVNLCILAAIVGGPLKSQAQTDTLPQPRQVEVNGVALTYVEQGRGAPVVFVHGAVSDLRAGEPQRQAVAKSHRFVSYDLRYHGTAAWRDDGRSYSYATHVADLAAFIRHLNAGPVHLVGLSSGGLIALLVALEHPDLVRSLTLREPLIRSLLAELPDAKPVLDDAGKALGPIVGIAKAGDAVRASKLLMEWVNNQPAGSFDTQPDAARAQVLDNARTALLTFSAPPPSPITCATLGSIKKPTLVIGGAQTRRFFSWIEEIVARCIPGARLVVIPNATHSVNVQQPAAFNEALLAFLAQH